MDFAKIAAWSVDFLRAVKSQSRFSRWLFAISLGKEAREELRGLLAALNEAGMDPDYER